MSLTSLRDTPQTNHSDHDDDYPLTANDILPMLMLDAVFPAKERAKLQAMASYALLVVVPTQAWSAPFATILGKKIGPRKLRIISGHKVSGAYGDPCGELRAHLSDGKCIIAVTHDPATCITNQLKAALDRTVTVGPPTLRMIRKAIKAISGTYPSTLVEADVAGLEADDILSAMRKGSTAAACVRRLRYAAELVTQPEVNTDNGFEAPLTESLPLPQHLRVWSQNLLADMAKVKDGTLAANALPSILLAGDPGTGKTLLAASLARSSGWAFKASSVGEWFAEDSGHLGSVNKHCRKIFDEAIQAAPCLLLLDEIDAMPSRKSMEPRDTQFWTPVITLLLTQIDALKRSGKPVLLVAASNYASRLDPALTRPGRIAQKIELVPPRTADEVKAVFAYQLGDSGLSDAELTLLARFAVGASQAQIEGWVSAARAYARTENRPLSFDDVMGQAAPPDERSPEEIWTIALHEAGHAVLALHFGLPLERVSILEVGISGGATFTWMPQPYPRVEHIEDMATVILAGRAADAILGDGAHAGARTDLGMATSLLTEAHFEIGLYDHLMVRSVATADPEMVKVIETDLQRLLVRAESVVNEHHAAIFALARELITRRVMDGNEVKRLCRSIDGVVSAVPS